MQGLEQKVLEHIRREELLRAGDRVGVAVSGGADSVALLRLLLELRREIGIVLSVVHFNHNLRGTESHADELFVAKLASEYKLELHLDGAEVSKYAAGKRMGLEAAARELRYGFFARLMGEAPTRERSSPKLNKVATGHTLDDQAETVLMRLIRGTGTRGLAGIHSRLAVENQKGMSGEVIRPLLRVRRHELEPYLKNLEQTWREDSTNRDSHFTRNRVRHTLLPLLGKEFNPAIAAGLAELADIAREEEDYWENEASGWMGTGIHWSEPDRGSNSGSLAGRGLVQLKSYDSQRFQSLEEQGPSPMNASVDLGWFLSEPIAVQRRIVKAVANMTGLPLEFKQVEEILEFAADALAPGKGLMLPFGWKLIREPEALVFLTPDPKTRERTIANYEYPLPLPGRAMVPEAGVVVEAVRVASSSSSEGFGPDQVLDPALLSPELRIRNWRPGDRFWPAHTKSPRKVKELLQQRHITGPERKLWPVALSGEEIVWLRGFPGPARLRAKGGGILIRELPLDGE